MTEGKTLSLSSPATIFLPHIAGFWDWFMQDSWGFEIDLCKIFGQITKIVFSTHALLYLIEFFKYAIPSAPMFCFEWWSFELLILIAGILPNPQLETSVLSAWDSFSMHQIGFNVAN
ncbi:hypothetical protein P8452_26000 [Trifolium repens]|nr:hypothetical protein P8452_26000 [Trifolium repens]